MHPTAVLSASVPSHTLKTSTIRKVETAATSQQKKKEGEKKLVVRLQLRKEVKPFFLSVSCVSAVLEKLLLLCVVTETPQYLVNYKLQSTHGQIKI